MSRFQELKRLDKKKRNKLRAILSGGDSNAISSLNKLRSTLGKAQSDALDAVLNNLKHEKAVQATTPFPKKPPFSDTVQPHNDVDLNVLMSTIEASAVAHKDRLLGLAQALERIDEAYAAGDVELCLQLILEITECYGWSHTLLRRIVLIRENLPDGQENEVLERLVQQADLNAVIVTSLVHAYAIDQSILTIKRSILNIADRGALNRYSRTLCKLAVQPFARCRDDLCAFLSEVHKCSLIDAIILAKFNSHLFDIDEYEAISELAKKLGRAALFDKLVATYDVTENESEYTFFKQSSAWLEYEPVRNYRILLDNYYDASRDEVGDIHEALSHELKIWVGDVTLSGLVGKAPFTQHSNQALAKLELSGVASRSAIFNYWLHVTDGQIGFETNDLFMLMGLTRDLARTIPIKATRNAASLAKDQLVRLILLLLLAKRSKNELDSFHLRKLLEEIAFKYHEGSLVKLVSSYEATHPYVAEYIYDIATEDFLAKLNRIAPHRADIPEIRASLHEWMAAFKKDEHYLQRARTVRIDHQLNRVRNEIDDHRIYVDPSRFSSWIEDEMMIELNNALTYTGAGKKNVAVSCDETLISLAMTQSYNTFCSNSVFGIASYIGRRIRHGTFHGHLYSSVINALEKNAKYNNLFRTPQFEDRWCAWKGRYNKAIDEIITNRLHINSRAKPLGLLQPEVFGPVKQEILGAAVKNIVSNYIETKSVAGIDQTITDYCWRLAECDLLSITKYLRGQQTPLKNLAFLKGEVLVAAAPADARLAEAFQRELELLIDRKLAAMFGWFKRPTIVAPRASIALLLNAIAAEVRDTIPGFALRAADVIDGEGELVGAGYHLVYDSLAIVVANAAKHGDCEVPATYRFRFSQGKEKRLVVEITSAISPGEDPKDVSNVIELRKKADFQDANMYQGKSGISKLLLLAQQRQDFSLEQYEVVGNEVKVRLDYVLEH